MVYHLIVWTITDSGIRRPGWSITGMSIVNVRPIIKDQNSPCMHSNICLGALFKQTVAALGELIYRKMKGFGLEDS